MNDDTALKSGAKGQWDQYGSVSNIEGYQNRNPFVQYTPTNANNNELMNVENANFGMQNLPTRSKDGEWGDLESNYSPEMGEECQEDEIEERLTDRKHKITHWQAGWNVTNAIQGMFVVSLPYAVLHGGWWGVFALVAVAYICYYTGLLLVECLYDDEGRRVLTSYKAVAEQCWGRPWGGRLVLGAQLTELLMTCILYIVLCGDLLEGSFPDAAMDKMGWMLLSTALLLPCAFLRDLRAVSWLSFWNTVSHILINLIILLYCLFRIGSWSWSSVKFTVNIDTFPTVLGIVVFSYTSHIFLPTLEGSMMDKKMFKPMLKYSHLAAALFKALFGLVGFLTFGLYTQDEVTNNLPTQTFKAILNFILVVKALLSYPLPYYAAVELLGDQFFKNDKKKSCSCFSLDGTMREWALAARMCLVLFTLFMAISVPHFALLMGLVGNITGTMLSFVWPSLFHLKMKGSKLNDKQKWVNRSIVLIGVVFGSVGVYYSSMQLRKAIYAVDEYE
uniref:Vesicular inhibitory amino acid transporter n=1 Tax=Romanomermis culicivorax TaxID=13658 RepID=A0A915L617_ROMCU